MKGYIISSGCYIESIFFDYVATDKKTIKQAVIKLFKNGELCLMTCDIEQELQIEINMTKQQINIKYLDWEGDEEKEILEFCETEILFTED